MAEILLALALAVAALNAAIHIRFADVPIYDMRLGAMRGGGKPRGLVVPGVVFVVTLATIACFALDVHRAVAGVATGLLLWVLRRWELRTWPGDTVVRIGKYAPAAAMLLGGLGAGAVAGLIGRDPEVARAWSRDGACGVFGACYLLATVSKLRKSGWSWSRSDHMALLLAERSVGRFGGLRRWIAVRPHAAAFVGWAGLGIEAGAILLVIPAARPWVGGGLFALLASTWFLFGYLEPEWMLAALATVVSGSS